MKEAIIFSFLLALISSFSSLVVSTKLIELDKVKDVYKTSAAPSRNQNHLNSDPYPYPPKQSKVQKELVEEIREEAEILSEKATPQVLELLNSKKVHQYLRALDDGSELYKKDGEELYKLMLQEFSLVEVVHNFGFPNIPGASVEGNCGMDLVLEPNRDIAYNAKYFYNQWMLQVLGFIPVDSANNKYTEYSETTYFHYPPFQNASNPQAEEDIAINRPIYGAFNLYRASGGNPQCGPISAVFNRDYILDEAIISPLDTGMYVGSCDRQWSSISNEAFTYNTKITKPTTIEEQQSDDNLTNVYGQFLGQPALYCPAWNMQDSLKHTSRPLGVPSALNHLLVPYLRYYAATRSLPEVQKDYVEYNLARLLIRLISRETYGITKANSNNDGKKYHNEEKASKWKKKEESPSLPLNFQENTFGYFEMNPAVNIYYPQGIKFIIGLFDPLFGTYGGKVLQEWCILKGWPLVWAHNPIDSTFHTGPDASVASNDSIALIENHYIYKRPLKMQDLAIGKEQANIRILDPIVLEMIPEGANITVSQRSKKNDDETEHSTTLLEFEEAKEFFLNHWSKVNSTLANLEKKNRTMSLQEERKYKNTVWDTMVLQRTNSQLLPLFVEPLYYNACEDTNNCMGLRLMDNTCVCKE